MKSTPRISQAELILMELIWADAPISGNEVAEKLTAKTDWHFRTIKTMLGRLVKKGVLTYKKQGKSYVYSPLIDRRQYINNASKKFVKQMFGGDASLALTHFVETGDFDKDQLDELMVLLKNKSRKNKNV